MHSYRLIHCLVNGEYLTPNRYWVARGCWPSMKTRNRGHRPWCRVANGVVLDRRPSVEQSPRGSRIK